METNQMAQPVQTPPPTPGTPNRKRNIAFAGIVMLMLASGAAYGYFTKAPTPPGTKPAIAWTQTPADQSGTAGADGTQAKNPSSATNKGTEWLVSEFVKIAKATNPDLVPLPVETSGNFQLLRFSCVISPEGMRSFLWTMNSKNDPSRKMNENDLTVEQIKILAVQMREDCENSNPVTVGKGLMFLRSQEALSLDDIAPSKIVAEMRKRMDVDAQSAVSRELDVLQAVLSYRKNINSLLNSPVQKKLLLDSYSSVLEAASNQGNADAKKLAASLAEVVTFYSK